MVSSVAQEERRIVAIVLPELLNELALQRALPSLPQAQCENTASRNEASPPSRARSKALLGKVPRAVVLTDTASPAWESKTQLDAVNSVARQLGVRPRQTIARATSIVENLLLQSLPRSCVSAALKQVAEVALGFGSPVSFEAPDTVWVDVTGSTHLFESERALGLELVATARALGYRARLAVASGPWLAQSFARYSVFDETGLLLVARADTRRKMGDLPIAALPISREMVTWFSRLGLLDIDDLAKLPPSALAARLDGQLFLPAVSGGDAVASSIAGGSVLDLIRGSDNSVIVPYDPEGLPFEQLCWDEPLESVEPLLFVLKGLCGRLCARLEGRGQAVQELLLEIQHDRSIAALRSAGGEPPRFSEQLLFRFASPLVHAEDVERVVRARLQRLCLFAPAVGLNLQALSLSEARHWQLNLRSDVGLGTNMSTDPRSVAILMAELSADIGDDAVGVLVESDHHLMEKTSCLVPMQRANAQKSRRGAGRDGKPAEGRILPARTGRADLMDRLPSLRLPTRLLRSPIEIHAPMKRDELWVLDKRPFVIEKIRFEQRLEAVEWWEPVQIYRDYFRVWLTAVEGRNTMREGLEILVYVDRDNGKSYIQALYD